MALYYVAHRLFAAHDRALGAHVPRRRSAGASTVPLLIPPTLVRSEPAPEADAALSLVPITTSFASVAKVLRSIGQDAAPS